MMELPGGKEGFLKMLRAGLFPGKSDVIGLGMRAVKVLLVIPTCRKG